MLRSMNKLSLRQTINHVVYELKDQGHEDGLDEEDFSWKDIVQRCLEVRQDRLLANIPDLTITDSQPSICLNENLFAELETGRDATHGEFSGQNLVLDCFSVTKSPRKSRSNRNSAVHLPTTLIEEVPGSPCSSASSSSYSLPHASPLNSPQSSLLQSPAISPVRKFKRSSTETLSNSANASVNESARSSRLSISKTNNRSLRRSLTESTPRSCKLSSPRSSRNSTNESSKRSSSSSSKKSPSNKRSASKSSPSTSSAHSSAVRSPRRSIIEEAILSFEESNKSARDSAISSTARSSNSSIVKSSERTLSLSSKTPLNSSHSSSLRSSRRSDSKIEERRPTGSSSLSPSCPLVHSSTHSSPSQYSSSAHSPARPSNSSHSPVGSSHSSAHSSPASSPARSSPVHSSACSPLKSTKKSQSIKTSKQSTQKLDGEISSRPKRLLRNRRLQTWRGERPIYKPMENGCFSIEGFTKPRTPDTLKRKKRSSKVGKTKIKKVNTEELMSDCDDNIKDRRLIDLSESLVQNSEITREKMKNILTSIQNLNWKKSKHSNQIEHAIIIRNKENGLVIGMFRFFGQCEKPPQKTANYSTTYTLMKGLVSIKIGDEPYMIINEFESLSIPGLTNYSIKNLVAGESVLQFHIVSPTL